MGFGLREMGEVALTYLEPQFRHKLSRYSSWNRSGLFGYCQVNGAQFKQEGRSTRKLATRVTYDITILIHSYQNQ